MKGFTLPELLIVIAITIILVSATIPIYGSLQVKAQLGDISAQLVQTLRQARQNSISGYHNARHGVFIYMDSSGDDSFTLYQGPSYIGRTSGYDIVTTLDSSLSFVNDDMTLTSSSIDINFSQGLGVPNNIGDFYLSHSVQGSSTIRVGSNGQVEEL